MKDLLTFAIVYLNIVILERQQHRHYVKKHWQDGDCVNTYSSGIIIHNTISDKPVARIGNQTRNLSAGQYIVWVPVREYYLENL